MNDTVRMVTRLQELHPDLMDPVDRFAQIESRVRERRRQAMVVVVGGVAVLALAVPVAAQLLPETAGIAPV